MGGIVKVNRWHIVSTHQFLCFVLFNAEGFSRNGLHNRQSVFLFSCKPEEEWCSELLLYSKSSLTRQRKWSVMKILKITKLRKRDRGTPQGKASLLFLAIGSWPFCRILCIKQNKTKKLVCRHNMPSVYFHDATHFTSLYSLRVY